MKHIVYLTETPFSKRDKERFGVDRFLNHGIQVTVLDVTYYMDKYVAENYHTVDQEMHDYVLKLKRFEEIKKFIVNTEDTTVFISFIGASSIKSLRILNVLSRYNKEFGIILSGSLPSMGAKQKINTHLKLFNLKNFLRLSLKAIYLMLTKKVKYSFVIASGSQSYATIGKSYEAEKIISGHAFDYDVYLEHKDDVSIKGQGYIVFLDEFVPFHPDYIRHGIDRSGIAEVYYKKLADLFDKLESYYKIPVVICAHPRSYYDELPDYWKGRKYILGDTVNLVKNAKLCLLHASTSINFAVLFKKPILFITMNELKNSNVQVLLEAMADELKAKIIDIDDLNTEGIEHPQIAETMYEQYKRKYIKRDDGQSINNWELLYDFFAQKS